MGRLELFFALNYFAQGMAGLAYEPVSYYLKDALGLGPAQAAAFVSWMTLPLALKPFFGPLTDMLPWAGRRRGPHLAAVSLLTACAWAALAALPAPARGSALALLVLVNIGFVMSDLVCDGVMVERGKERGLTGRYQALQIGTLYFTLVLTGLGGGWLAQNAAPRAAFALAALFPLITAASASLVDEPAAGGLREASSAGWAGLKALVADPRARAAAGGIFLWSFAPFLGTAQFYYQSEAAGLSPLFIGGLSTVGGVAGMAGAALYARLERRDGRLLEASVLVGAPLTLLYAFYRDAASILALTALFSLSGVVFRLAWMDLAARLSPKGAEATAFAAFMAVFNLAALASNAAGGALYGRLAPVWGAYPAMLALSGLGAVSAAAAWPLLRRARPSAGH